jgi:hypothetical protein
LQAGQVRLADALGGGILVEQLQYPRGGKVVLEVGQFGKPDELATIWCKRLMAWVDCLTLACNRPATSRRMVMA